MPINGLFYTLGNMSGFHCGVIAAGLTSHILFSGSAVYTIRFPIGLVALEYTFLN